MLVNTETLGSGTFETNHPAIFTVLRYFNIMTGNHRDFTVQWFHEVGTAVLLTLILNVLEPHVLPVIKAGFNKLKKEVYKHRMVIQYDLNKLHTGSNFEPEVRYPQVIMPILSHTLSSSPCQPTVLWPPGAQHPFRDAGILWRDANCAADGHGRTDYHAVLGQVHDCELL